MKSIKFSILSGFIASILYMMIDVVRTFFALFFGFIGMPSQSLNPLAGGMDFLMKISDKNYWIAFIVGFLVSFPIFYFKKRIDKWAKKVSVEDKENY